MRVYIAGFLTALIFIPVYFVVPRMKHQYEGFGTELPKYLEVIIALSNTCVNYFYIVLPLLFFSFRFLAGLVVSDRTGKDDRE
jgi:type II secretory pathway component PulF